VRPCSKPVLREGFSQIGYLHKHTAIMVGRGCDILTLAIRTVLFSVILVTLFFAMIADYVIGSLRGRQVAAAGMARVPGLSHADFERSGDGRLRTARPLRRAVRMVRLTTSSAFLTFVPARMLQEARKGGDLVALRHKGGTRRNPKSRWRKYEACGSFAERQFQMLYRPSAMVRLFPVWSSWLNQDNDTNYSSRSLGFRRTGYPVLETENGYWNLVDSSEKAKFDSFATGATISYFWQIVRKHVE